MIDEYYQQDILDCQEFGDLISPIKIADKDDISRVMTLVLMNPKQKPQDIIKAADVLCKMGGFYKDDTGKKKETEVTEIIRTVVYPKRRNED